MPMPYPLRRPLCLLCWVGCSQAGVQVRSGNLLHRPAERQVDLTGLVQGVVEGVSEVSHKGPWHTGHVGGGGEGWGDSSNLAQGLEGHDSHVGNVQEHSEKQSMATWQERHMDVRTHCTHVIACACAHTHTTCHHRVGTRTLHLHSQT